MAQLDCCIIKCLADGECYEFYYANKKLKGFYKKATGRFYYLGGFIHASVCERPRLLN